MLCAFHIRETTSKAEITKRVVIARHPLGQASTILNTMQFNDDRERESGVPVTFFSSTLDASDDGFRRGLQRLQSKRQIVSSQLSKKI